MLRRFGDNTTSTRTTGTHTCSRPGSYPLSLTATHRRGGTGTARQGVGVRVRRGGRRRP